MTDQTQTEREEACSSTPHTDTSPPKGLNAQIPQQQGLKRTESGDAFCVCGFLVQLFS